MASYTDKLKLFKYDPEQDGESVFSINQALNENWDKIDDSCGKARFSTNILFDTKYSVTPLYSKNWLCSNGQWNQSTFYPTVWSALLIEADTLIDVGSTVTIGNTTYVKRGLPVQNSSTSFTDTDFVVDTDNNTFRLPLKNSWDLPYERTLVSRKESSDSDPSWYNWYSDGWIEQGGMSSLTTGEKVVNLSLPYSNTSYVVLKQSRYNGNSDIANRAIYNVTTSSFQFYDSYAYGSSWYACGYGAIPSEIVQYNNVFLYYYVGDIELTDSFIDTSLMAEYISGLVDCKVIIDSYSNGSSWYRKWSDGWLEQGGISPAISNNNTTVTFLEKYTTCDYGAQLTAVSDTTYTYADRFGSVRQKNMGSLVINERYASSNTATPIQWYTYGY